MDYLRSGWGINTSFAIDFTASNGEVFEPDSLHKIDPSGRNLNQYEEAILGVGKIIEPYALNSQFAVFGFGGIPRYMGANKPSHCFNLNGQPNPIMIGLQNVYLQYKYAISNTGLAGPTYFSHVLRALLAYV
jgi:Copine